jgi:hypothetical protein
MTSFGRFALRGFWVVGAALALLPAAPVHADWWSENVEVHGFARTESRFNSPGFKVQDGIQLNSLRADLNFETTIDIYDGDKLKVSNFSVLRPSYDAVYELYPHIYGKRAKGGKFGTQTGALFGDPGIPKKARDGKDFRGAGNGVTNEFRYVNGDVAFLLFGENNPALVVDDVVFFGSLVSPASPRSSKVPSIGRAPTADTFRRSRDVLTGFLPGLFGVPQGVADSFIAPLAGSVAMASQPLGTPLRSPAQIDAGLPALGNRKSFKQSPFGINDRQSQLATDCRDNAHPYCFVREFYFNFEYGDSLLKVGKQQIVWGKSDAFRLQDIVNPLDLGLRSIFVPLEDQRIPTLSADFVQTLGQVGPLQDVSLELVWVFDRFLPIQVGQCGDPRAFSAACQGRQDVGAYTAIGIAIAEVEERDWKLKNTEPGFRLEFVLPQPQISFSLSGFLGFQDLPVARLRNPYSVDNPNPGALLLLQTLSAAQAQMSPVPSFDPYSASSIRTAGATLAGTYSTLVNVICGSAVASGDTGALASCIGGNNQGFAGAGIAPGFQINQLLLPFQGGPFTLEYPRVFTLGASADYQIPGVDSILRFEMAYDFGRSIQDTGEPDLIDQSDVISAVVGVDLNPFIKFLNPNRTSFVSGQLFAEHILNYDDEGNDRRFVPDRTQLIATLFMQNFFRNDGLIVTNFLAYDVNAQALAAGPSVKYILNDQISFEFGANIVLAKRQKRPLRNLCAGAADTVDCLVNPSLQQAGNFQGLNRGLVRKTQSPFFSAESFGDELNEDRDEIFFNITYQF